MRLLSLTIAALLVAGGACTVNRLTDFPELWPEPSQEIVQLTPEKRAILRALRAERKFRPHDHPPLGYTGPDTPEDEPILVGAVEGLIDAVLRQPDGPLHASTVIEAMGETGEPVESLATEDRERAYGYMTEVWYILGFKDATGRFANGEDFRTPEGYGEPLPPGWMAADRPRPLN